MRRESDRTTLFVLCDRIYNGHLEETLRRWRDAGVSYRAIQRLLADELHVRIALDTIRGWIRTDDTNGAAA